jgi:hypothetical protein
MQAVRTRKKKGEVEAAQALAEMRALARGHAPAALAALARLAVEGDSEQARLAACNAILDRAYGKPTQPLDATLSVSHEDALKALAAEAGEA